MKNKLKNIKTEEIEAELNLRKEQDYIFVPELNLEITQTQKFNGKNYTEIINLIGEENIATYDELKTLRNIAFKSKWKKYLFIKNFWVFVPNIDEASKQEGKVARFSASDVRTILICYGNRSNRYADLGVFLVRRKIKSKKQGK